MCFLLLDSYACPQYHNNKDRRRSPKKFKYRSTPCPNVKNGDEWGDPSKCESEDNCSFCHTRTEQQFHPEIYKSNKCNDIKESQYCPRGPFCAFAHAESTGKFLINFFFCFVFSCLIGFSSFFLCRFCTYRVNVTFFIFVFYSSPPKKPHR